MLEKAGIEIAKLTDEELALNGLKGSASGSGSCNFPEKETGLGKGKTDQRTGIYTEGPSVLATSPPCLMRPRYQTVQEGVMQRVQEDVHRQSSCQTQSLQEQLNLTHMVMQMRTTSARARATCFKVFLLVMVSLQSSSWPP